MTRPRRGAEHLEELMASDDVTAAAKRLIAEAAIAEREMLHMYSREHRPDYLTVAHAALEAVDDRARLLGEVEALKEALQKVVVVANRVDDLGGSTWQCGEIARAALDAAPAGAGEAVSDG